ncbi:MAG: hypothetical protein IT221_07680 [Fluviicola sp.]|nr:hypothetical protein [Fluviicola sp.]
MKIINTLIISCLAVFNFAQTTISANGRSFTFNKESDYRSGDWSRSTSTYQDISNDSIYIGYIDNDDTYGVSYSLKAYYVYDYLPSSMKKPASRQDFILKERKLDSYGGHSIVTFSFENEEKFLAFYNKLIGSLNADYKQKIADAEKGILSEEEQALRDKGNQISNKAIDDANAKRKEYDDNFYSFDPKIHSSEVQIVTVYSSLNEAVLKYDRGSTDVFQMINGKWKKIGIIYNFFDMRLEFADSIVEIAPEIFSPKNSFITYDVSEGTIYDFRFLPEDQSEMPPAEMQITALNSTAEQTLSDLNLSGIVQETFTFNGKTGVLTSDFTKAEAMHTSGGKLTVGEMALLYQLFRTIK